MNVSQLDALRCQIPRIRRSPRFACHHPSPSPNNCRRKPPVRHLQCSHHYHPHRCCCTERLEAHKLLLFRVPSIYNRTAKVFPPFRCFFFKIYQRSFLTSQRAWHSRIHFDPLYVFSNPQDRSSGRPLSCPLLYPLCRKSDESPTALVSSLKIVSTGNPLPDPPPHV